MSQGCVLWEKLILAYNVFMSESRQRFTGRVLLRLSSVVFLWLLFVTLPFFTSDLQVVPMDPRWLTPADLTWQRMVFNLLSKPGFRLILVGLCGLGMELIGLSWRKVVGKRNGGVVRVGRHAPFSLEWVIDGSRKDSLSEYGRFVGVV